MNSKTTRLLAGLMVLVLILSAVMSALAYETIPFGEESSRVRALQRALKSKGFYSGDVDGTYGQKTRSAVYRYQKSIGITADGRAGNKTLTALYDGLSAANAIDSHKQAAIIPTDPDTLCYGCTGPRVSSLQKALRNAGYYKGSIDGKFGDLLLIAVKRYQWAHGLHGDGLVGSQTLSSINRNQSRQVSKYFLLTIGSRGDTVLSAQRKLISLGYTIDDIKGYYGSSTATAVRTYQTTKGHTVTGTLTVTGYDALIDNN